LTKIREFYGRVIAHGVVPEVPNPEDFALDKMLAEKNAFVASRGGTVRQPIASSAVVGDDVEDENEEDLSHE
jgi:hypothetical protein